MLGRFVARSAPLRLAARRSLCTAPAETPAIVAEIREAIADMKNKMAAKPGADEAYSPAAFESALKSGTVDISLLSTTLGEFDPSAKKLAMKCVTDSNMMNKEQAAEEATMAGYDWSQWERKGLDAATIAEVKGIMEAAAAAEGAAVPEMIKENKLDELEKEIKAAFEGSGGFLEEAAKQEKAAEAAMLQCIADLEKLEVDALGLRDVTIAEILEREPELREEIEEEIRNNNWGY